MSQLTHIVHRGSRMLRASCPLVQSRCNKYEWKWPQDYDGPMGHQGFVEGNADAKSWAPHIPTAKTIYRRNTKALMKAKEFTVPEQFKHYDKEFEQVVDLETQLRGLESRGFLRAYKAFTPPENTADLFMKVCADVIPGFDAQKANDLSQIKLTDPKVKAEVLSALSVAFDGHRVPNSMLHTIASLDEAFLFYSTKVDVRTPYEKLYTEQSKGNLPTNLHIILDEDRFTGKGDNEMTTVSAFPRDSVIYTTPEDRKKYEDYVPQESPWINAADEEKDGPKPYRSQ